MNGELDRMTYRACISYVWSDRYKLVIDNEKLQKEFESMFIIEHDETLVTYREFNHNLISTTTRKEVAQEFAGRNSKEFGALLICGSSNYCEIEVDGYNGESEIIMKDAYISLLKAYNR